MKLTLALLLVATLAAPAAAASPRLPEGWERTLGTASPATGYLDRANVFDAAAVPWQTLDPFTRRKVVFSDRVTLVLMEARRSGRSHDLRHWHTNDQVSHILEGTAEVIVGREIRRVGPGSFYVCEANVPHSARILSDRLSLVEAFTPPRHDFRNRSWVGAASPAARPLLVNEVKALVYAWFALFDRNAPVADFLPYLADHGLVMDFPGVPVHSKDEFRRWYADILAHFRSASHDIRSLDVAIAGARARVSLVVHWQAVGFDGKPTGLPVVQKWSVSRDRRTGGLTIDAYRVQPLPGAPGQ